MSPNSKRTRIVRAYNLRLAAFPARSLVAQVLACILLVQTFAPPALAAQAHGVSPASFVHSAAAFLAGAFGKMSVGARAASTQTNAVVPAAEEFGVVLTPLGTAFNGHAGIEHHQPLRKVLVSSNTPTGAPFNFETLDADGAHRPYSNLAGLTGDLKLATARDDGAGISRGGFKPGELFTGTGAPGVIARVAPDGASVQNPWVTLAGEPGESSGGLFVDRTGVFGGDLIAVTSAGAVWRINSAGAAARIASLGTPLEGVTTIPDDAVKYGPWAGKILAGAKEQASVYAIDAQGNSTAYELGLNPSDIRVIPAHENFYGVDPTGGKLWGAPDDAFAGIIGDILIAQGSPGVLARVGWNGTKFEVGHIAQVSSWRQITFSPAPLSAVGGVKEVYDKIAVVRHAPELESGRVEGALWQLLPENVALNGTDAITSDLLVPGTPTVMVGSGKPSFDGVIEGVESAQPTGYTVSISNNASLRHVITRTDAIDLMPVPAPPATAGTRDVSLTKAGETIGDAATLRHLSITGKAGAVVVPPGTYGKFTAGGHTRLVFGVEGATTPSVYNLEDLSLSGGSELRVLGAVKLNVRGNVSLSGASVGAADNPQRLLLSVAQGSVGVTGGGVLYGIVRIPQGTVSVGGNGRIRGTVTCDRLNIHGNGVLQITESDVAPPPVNRPPTADAGADQSITLPADVVSLNGTATDDGLPDGSTLTTAWTKVSGPGAVAFSAPGDTITTATLTEPGVYVLRLSANDSLLAVSDDVTVEVIPRNQPPEVNAGIDQIVELPETATLAGIVADDALPRGASVTKTWSVVSAPGEVVFADAHDLATAVTFAAPGDYTLRLTADDTEFAISDDVLVKVYPENQKPSVNAGADQTLRLPDAATLNGTATDDGWPDGSTLTTTWTKVSGPGTVTFADAAAPVTGVQFGIEGSYVLRLTASDTRFTVSDECVVTVLPQNAPPTVDAGADREITFPDALTLNGTASDDGMPDGSILATAWRQLSGPGTATFVKPHSTVTGVTFSAPGVYTLELIATDSELSSSDTLVVTVIRGNQPPIVNAGPDQIIVFPASASLSGAVTDDGLPTGGTLTTKWSKLSGPGLVTFGNFDQSATTASFGEAGTYVLRLEASDSLKTASDEVSISVRSHVNAPPDITSEPPTAFALSPVPVGEGDLVNLNPWTVKQYELNSQSNANWTKDLTNNVATQTVNADASFLLSDFNLSNTQMEGSWRVNTNSDDDFIGFVFGYQNSERFYLFDWKKGSQSGAGFAERGMSVKVVNADSPLTDRDFWPTAGNGARVRTLYHNTVPWQSFTDYRFKLQFHPGQIRIVVNQGETVLADFTVNDTTYVDGHFGFYNYSQAQVRYSGFRRLSLVQGNYVYDVEAVDPDGDALVYSLDAAPNGMTIDPATGLITWPVTRNEEGRHTVTVRVRDPAGASDTQSYTLNITDPSKEPVFKAYTLDADFDEGSFSNVTRDTPDQLQLLEAENTPTGAPEQGTWSAVFDSARAGAEWGRIGWTSRVCGDGLLTVTVATGEDGTTFGQAVTVANGSDPEVSVGRYARVSVKFERASSGESPVLQDLIIGTAGFEVATPANLAPAVDAGDDRTLAGITRTTLRAAACDDGLPSNQRLTISWSKVSGPGAVAFARPDSASTEVTFSTTGTYELRLTAADSALTGSDTLVVEVLPPNESPVVNGGTDLSATHPDAAALQGTVTDDGLPRGGQLNITWSKVSGPGGVAFAQPNAASTTARFGAPGAYVLRVTASDTELVAHDEVTVNVGGENQTPAINAGSDRTITQPNTAALEGTATDDGWPEGGTFAVSWSKVSGPGSVAFGNSNRAATSASFDQPGDYVLRLSGSDSLLSASDEVSITVNPPVPPPVVSISGLPDGAEVTTRVNVTGTVSAGNNWRLEYTLGHGVAASNWTTFASGNTPVAGGMLGVFDPTLLLNGTYTLRLVATNSAGQTAATSISVIVDGGQKVGNFSLSFADLKVPVARLPFQVLRTYDSRDKRNGDFGVGWTLGLRNVRVEKSDILGADWEQTRRGSIIASYCLEPRKPHVVTVTFPDGKVYRFRTVTSPQCGALTPFETASMRFAPLPGTHGALAAVGDNDVLVLGNAPGPVELRNFGDLKLFDPTLFQLTTEDGSLFIIDQTLGVRRITDTNGNTLTVNANGITHSSGRSIVFTRDAQGRITQITDPAGNAMTYGYDANGDLVSFTDRERNTTTFTYNTTHGLLTINDPQGRQPIRNEYDADGRLVSHTDALGKVVTYGHDLTNRVETVTDRLGKTSRTEYDARGNVVRSVDANGATATFTYDGNDNVLTSTDALGRTSSFTYNANGYRTSITDPLGNVTRMTYNNQGRVLTVVDPLGRTSVNSYDSAGNPLSSKDPLGNETRYTYSPTLGLPTTTTDALGHTTSYEHTGARLTKVIDALGNTTTFAYDANGNQTSTTVRRTAPDGTPETLTTTAEYNRLDQAVKITYPDGSTESTLYNQNGKPATVTDQLGRRTTYEYDESGRLIRTTSPDGTTVQSAYDAEGRLLKSTDQAGRATSYAYDAVGRPSQTTYPDGSTEATAYDSVGQVVAVTDALGRSKRYEYDALGRRAKVVDALGRVKTFTYDAASNQLSFVNAVNQRTTYEYDANNRETKTVFPDGTATLASYDAGGRVTQRTNQAGRSVSYQYDALHRLVKVTDALGQATNYAYDETGNLISQTDARNHTVRFEYDRAGQRTRRTLPLGMAESYTYDQGGRLQTKTDFRGYVTTYAYDIMGRLLSRTPDPRLGEQVVRYTYTTTGQRASMTDATGVNTYAYDSRDRLTGKATPQGTLAYAYDLAGNLKSVASSHADGVSQSYAYDTLNRLTTVTDRQLDAVAADYTYDLSGNLDSATYANGVKSAYTYDPLNRLTALTSGKTSTLASYSYTLGAAGNRLAVAELSGRAVSYTYDALFRLTGETVANSPAALNGAVNYTYDEVGNRLARTSTLPGLAAQTFTYDANDRLVGDTYDANGNTTVGGGSSYDYDSHNQLITANGGAARFTYDGDGNRVAKTVGGVTTHYLIDTNNPTGHAQVAEEIVGGSVSRVYTYGHDLVSQRQQLGGQWKTSFYGYDGHGSVRFLTDEAGAVTDTYDYDAYGNLIASTGTTPNDYLYAGEQRDASLGLYYLRARYLNAGTGRFQTADSYEGSAADPPSLHKYLYAEGDPVNHIDPSGYSAIPLSQVELNTNLIMIAALAVIVAPIALVKAPLRLPSDLTAEDDAATATATAATAAAATEAAEEPSRRSRSRVRVRLRRDDEDDNSEIFYRAMSDGKKGEYPKFSQSNELALKTEGGPGRELFVTQDLNYLVWRFLWKSKYPAIVKFYQKLGTKAALRQVGGADDSIYDNVPSLSDLPRIEPDNPHQVHFKYEHGAITYGLRRKTIHRFNERIKEWRKIAENNQLLPGN